MSREILKLSRREDGVFEFYEDGELAEEWTIASGDEVWGWMVVKLLRHLKNIGEKRLSEVKMTKRCHHKWEQKPDYPEDIICRNCETIKKVSQLTRQQFLKLPIELRRTLLSQQVAKMPCGLFGESL